MKLYEFLNRLNRARISFGPVTRPIDRILLQVIMARLVGNGNRGVKEVEEGIFLFSIRNGCLCAKLNHDIKIRLVDVNSSSSGGARLRCRENNL